MADKSEIAEKLEPTMEEKIDRAIETAKGILPSRAQKDDVQKVAQSVLNLAHAKAIQFGLKSQTTEMDHEIALVLGMVRPALNPTELMQVTQAVLHLMNAKQLLTEGKPTQKKQGSGT